MPNDFNPLIWNFWSLLEILVMGDKWGFGKFAGGEDDIMLGGYKGGLKLADNLL